MRSGLLQKDSKKRSLLHSEVSALGLFFSRGRKCIEHCAFTTSVLEIFTERETSLENWDEGVKKLHPNLKFTVESTNENCDQAF